MNQLRWALVEWLLGLVLRIAPMDAGGEDLNRTLLPWFERQLRRL